MRTQYENFVTTWSMFDPEATGCIEWHVLPKLLQQLDEPLGFGPDSLASVKEMTTFIGASSELTRGFSRDNRTD
jgi:hypothetical protein